jgi:hypothetical protein
MRLNKSEALNPNDHLCEQRETSVVLPGHELKIQTTANFRMEMYLFCFDNFFVFCFLFCFFDFFVF